MDNLSWQTIEYLHTKKTADWYWVVGIVTISIALIAIIMNNIIFAILIIVCSFTLALFASRPPEIIDVIMDKDGVIVGKTRHRYKEIESFWVETREAIPRVLLKSRKVFMPYIVIHIEDVTPEEVRHLLSGYLPEEEHSEPLLEKILLYLGF